MNAPRACNPRAESKAMQFVQLEGGSMTGKIMHTVGECNLCGQVNLFEFVDGKTRMGPWANMCMPCFKHVGVGLGVGRGQRYARLAEVSGSLFDSVDMKAKAHAAQAHMRAKAALFADVWDQGEPTE